MTLTLEEATALLQKGEKKELSNSLKYAQSIAFNCDGSYLAVGGEKSVRVWLTKNWSGSPIVLKGPSPYVNCLAWHPKDPNTLVAVSDEPVLYVWDLKASTSKPFKTVKMRCDRLFNVSFDHDGSHIVAVNRSDQCAVLSSVHKMVKYIRYPNDSCNEFAFTPDHMLIGRGRGNVDLVRAPPRMEFVASYPAHTASCFSIQLSPGGKYFATGGADAQILIWDLAERIAVRTIDRMDYPIRALAFNHTGELLVSGSEAPFLDIALVETGELVLKVPMRKGCSALDWHPKENILAYVEGSRDDCCLKILRC